MNNTELQFKHDFSPEDGHSVELTIRCRLGAAPSLLQQLVESTIQPLAQRYDPHWKPQTHLPVTPADADTSGVDDHLKNSAMGTRD